MEQTERIALIKQIHSLLERLSEDEFLQFCQLYYQEVYYRVFTTGMTQRQRERLLIERAEKGQTLSQLPHQLQATFSRTETEANTISWDDFPLEDVPAVAVLPLGSEMPLGVNPTFVGRQDELKQLAKVLYGGGTAVVGETTASVTGAGGIGKSQLAAAFVHRYGQYFTGGVYWLNFSQPQAISSEISNCAGAVKIPRAQFEALPEPERVAHVQRAWQEPTPRLLIFDNCEDPALLTKWQPITGGCRVLLTSRRTQWEGGRGIKTVALDTLPPPDCVTLLKQLAPQLDASGAGQIAEAVGWFPLAVYVAGSYVGLYGVAVDSFLRQFEEKKLAYEALQGEGLSYSPTGHLLSVSATFALSWEQLQPDDDPIDAEAIQLLAVASQYAPDEPIPERLWLLPFLPPDEDKEASEAEVEAVTEQMAKPLYRLRQLGFMPEGKVRLHRLLALFVQKQVGLEIWQFIQEVVEITVEAEIYRLNKVGLTFTIRDWLPHLTHLVEQALVRTDELSASLASGLGYHLKQDGAYKEARLYYERALKIDEETLGANHPHTATSLNNLGMLLKEMGAYREALPYLERALQIDKKVLGANHPSIATNLNNFGLLLQEMGAYGEALPYLKRALQIHEAKLGVSHELTALSLSNLGSLLIDMEAYTKSLPYLERALQIWEVELGVSHPSTAVSLNNLGLLLQEMGEYGKSLPHLKRALQIWEVELGASHPTTSDGLNNLGMLLKEMGAYEEAQPYLERALQIREAELGANHPHTAQSLNNLGILLKEMGEYVEALSYVVRALAIFEAQLGTDHPSTKTVRGNLQIVLDAQAGEEG